MNIPMTKQFTCSNKHKINLVPVTNTMPVTEISAGNLECLIDVCFDDDRYHDLANYSNDANIQVSIHPQTNRYYAIYHTSPREAYVIRIDKVALTADAPVSTPAPSASATTPSNPVDILRNGYLEGRQTFEADIKEEERKLVACKGNATMEATARQRIKKAKESLRRLNDDIDNFEQEHGALC